MRHIDCPGCNCVCHWRRPATRDEVLAAVEDAAAHLRPLTVADYEAIESLRSTKEAR